MRSLITRPKIITDIICQERLIGVLEREKDYSYTRERKRKKLIFFLLCSKDSAKNRERYGRKFFEKGYLCLCGATLRL